jgi:hypothetical protein
MTAAASVDGGDVPTGRGDRASRRRPGIAEVLTDESGQPFVVRSSTARDRAALDELRAATEAIGGTNAYFGATDPTSPVVHAGDSWPRTGTTIVAERGDALIGAGHYARHGEEAAVALAVRQGPTQREIGAHLVVALATVARTEGVRAFVAELSTKNAVMLATFVGAGFATEIGVGDGVMLARFDLDAAPGEGGRTSVRAVPVWRAVDGPVPLKAPGA